MNIDDIIKNYGKYIKSQIYLLDKDDNVINEVYQRVLITLWEKAPETINFKYLSKLVKNAFIDNYRRHKRHLNYAPIDDLFSIADFDSSHLVVTKEDAIATELQLHELLQKIDNLKESQRDVVLLRLAGYNFIEIANIMNVTQNNAIGQMYYAKQNLIKKQWINHY